MFGNWFRKFSRPQAHQRTHSSSAARDGKRLALEALEDRTTPSAFAYITESNPWGQTTNDAAMDAAFGANHWSKFTFDNATANGVFTPGNYKFLFFDGSNTNGPAFETFVNTNLTAMQNWVSDGGSIFLDAARNVYTSQTMSVGFNASLTNQVFASYAWAVDPSQPIFVGPQTPVGTSWSGNSFAHDQVNGSGLTPLLKGNGGAADVVLGEENWGSGHVLVGGMTTDNFHSPQPQAHNLLINLLAYGASRADNVSVTADQATVSANEGQFVSNTGTFNDPDGDNVTLTASVGTITQSGTSTGTWTWSLPANDDTQQSVPVTITANDGQGGVTTTSFTYTVNNVPPTIAISGAGSVNEGSPYTLNLGAITDPGNDDQVTQWTVNWGDNTSNTYSSGGAVTHVYAVPSSADNITVDLTDQDGTHVNAAHPLSVTVNDVPPTVSADQPSVSVPFGQTVTNTGTFGDSVGNAVTVTASAGTLTQTGSSNGSWNWSLSGSAATGPIQVTITASDQYGDMTTTNFTYSVTQVTPTVTVTDAGGVYTGDPFTATALVTGVNGQAATSLEGVTPTLDYFQVNGDGSFTDLGAAAPVKPGTYVVTAHFAGSADYTSADSALVAEPGTPGDPAGSITGYSGTRTKASYVTEVGKSMADVTDITALIHQNADGPGPTVVVAAPPGSPYSYELVNHNDGVGNYVLLGVSEATRFTIAPPTMSISGASSVNEGATYTLNLGPINNLDPNDTVTAWTVNWGDGTSYTYSAGGNVTHVYTVDTASDNITVGFTDQVGTYTNVGNPLRVTVNNVGPQSLSITGLAQAARGQPLTYTGNYMEIDPTDMDTSAWTVTNSSNVVVAQGSGTSLTFTPTDAGNYTVAFTVTDSEGLSAQKQAQLTVSPVVMENDPLYGGTMLVIGGTNGNDNIFVNRGTGGVGVAVSLDGPTMAQQFTPTSRIVIYGQNGNDYIYVAPNVTISAWEFAGSGTDTLMGGGGNNVLIGGGGKDLIVGGGGNNVLIAGPGASRLTGGTGSNLMIAGTTIYDTNQAALAGILNEWASGGSYQTRINVLSQTYLMTGPTAAAATVFSNGGGNMLTSRTATDWIFANLSGASHDTLANRYASELVEALLFDQPSKVGDGM